MTLRVGDQLVGVRADTDATAATIRTRFAAWLESDATGEHGEPIPWAFNLRLDPDDHAAAPAGDTRRGPKAVPQLRIGRSLLARSRLPDNVLSALDQILGGVLARQDDTRRWLGLRTIVRDGRVVLVDAAPPALTADPRLARAGVTELPTWSVAVDGGTVLVPPPLTADPSTNEGGESRSFELVGLVGLDSCSHDADRAAPDTDHEAIHHPTNPGALLARFAARHPSSEWFQTVERFVDAGNVHTTTDRTVAGERIRRLLLADHPTG